MKDNTHNKDIQTMAEFLDLEKYPHWNYHTKIEVVFF